jgi:hypothetical protein
MPIDYLEPFFFGGSLIKVIASQLQAGTHFPQEMQPSFTRHFISITSSTSTGQTKVQAPHPMHFKVSIFTAIFVLCHSERSEESRVFPSSFSNFEKGGIKGGFFLNQLCLFQFLNQRINFFIDFAG